MRRIGGYYSPMVYGIKITRHEHGATTRYPTFAAQDKLKETCYSPVALR